MLFLFTAVLGSFRYPTREKVAKYDPNTVVRDRSHTVAEGQSGGLVGRYHSKSEKLSC